MKAALFLVSLIGCVWSAAAQQPWRELFNGRDLTGWKPNAYPNSWSVVDGTIRAKATRESSHLFFVGAITQGFPRFKDFELEVEAKGEPNSNSGIYIHTDMATQNARLHLTNGYEIQLNSTGEGRATGSLYAVKDFTRSPVDESQWFKLRVTVRGQRIIVHVNDRQVVDYTEPANVRRDKAWAGRKLNPAGGAIALQAHDPKSVFYFRRIRLRLL
jgi:hypothetical protein